MYANVCWMGCPEAWWEIKALRDGEGSEGGQHDELSAAILNGKKNNPGPIVTLVVKVIADNLPNTFVQIAA